MFIGNGLGKVLIYYNLDSFCYRSRFFFLDLLGELEGVLLEIIGYILNFKGFIFKV